MYKKITNYFKKHVTYNSFVHAVGGIGIGVLIASPIVGIHPLRWGLGLIGLSLLGHLYAAVSEK
ncbi:MAG: hypothetical protein Q7R31_01725 [Candidatus Levybacteria bacterium]|nr:hypothetical protein [Candidatus Levybacteria bacterium]